MQTNAPFEDMWRAHMAELQVMAMANTPSPRSRMFWKQRRCYRYFDRMGRVLGSGDYCAGVCETGAHYCFEAAELWQCKQKAIDDFKHEYVKAKTGASGGETRADAWRNLYVEIDKGGAFCFIDFNNLKKKREGAERVLIKAILLLQQSLIKHGGRKCQRLLIQAN